MLKPPGYSTVIPYIFASRAAEYVHFLRRAFAAREVGRSLRPEGTIANCQLRIDDSVLMVSEAGEGFAPSQAAFYLYVEDVHEAMAVAEAEGATIVMQIADMPYGDKQGGVKDPCGNTWWLSQRMQKDSYF